MASINIKINLDENNRISGVEIMDTSGNTTYTINTQNIGHSAPNTANPEPDNLSKLTSFCKSKKPEYKNKPKMLGQLVRFFEGYKKRIETGQWNGPLYPEKLWETWVRNIK